jgi:hypothetical protein
MGIHFNFMPGNCTSNGGNCQWKNGEKTQDIVEEKTLGREGLGGLKSSVWRRESKRSLAAAARV